jgi:hypothetical protein
VNSQASGPKCHERLVPCLRLLLLEAGRSHKTRLPGICLIFTDLETFSEAVAPTPHAKTVSALKLADPEYYSHSLKLVRREQFRLL